MFDAFRDGMRELGYVEGRNVIIEPHWGEGSNERLDRLAVELVKSNPRMIVTQGGPGATPWSVPGPRCRSSSVSAAIPWRENWWKALLVLAAISPACPCYRSKAVGKRMELLKEVIPALKRVAILANPQHPGEAGRVARLTVRGQAPRPHSGIFSTSRNSQT